MGVKKKKVAILGSTGSIGTQALEVIENNSDILELTAITANLNHELLIEQAFKHVPSYVAIADKSKYPEVKRALSNLNIKVLAGEEALSEIVTVDEVDIVIASLVGFVGLRPTIEAIKKGKDIALANKETLVVAGDIITKLAREHGSNIYPVDSEHSAIFQCLVGENNSIEKIYLTASGGPFRGMTYEQLKKVTLEQALAHPNWCMGNKVTIDSASLMNKGLEAIEARWLFHLEPEQIDIVVHPQSIIHSIVQFDDGSMKAQMGLPDMRLPIQYALTYPKRVKTNFQRFDFIKYPNLTFEFPDTKNFRNLAMAFEAMKKGGNMPCIMNAANEIAVEAFICGRVKFIEMPGIIEKAMEKVPFINDPGFEDLIGTNTMAREFTSNLIEHNTY